MGGYVVCNLFFSQFNGESVFNTAEGNSLNDVIVFWLCISTTSQDFLCLNWRLVWFISCTDYGNLIWLASLKTKFLKRKIFRALSVQYMVFSHIMHNRHFNLKFSPRASNRSRNFPQCFKHLYFPVPQAFSYNLISYILYYHYIYIGLTGQRITLKEYVRSDRFGSLLNPCWEVTSIVIFCALFTTEAVT
jgi:hypothetical protein